MSDGEKRFRLRFLLRAILAWLLCAAALLLCVSVFYAADGASLSTMGYASSAISFFAALAAGTCAAGAEREKRYLAVLISAVALCSLLLLVGFLIAGRLDQSAVISVVSFTFAGALVGALLSGGKRKKRKGGRQRKKVYITQ